MSTGRFVRRRRRGSKSLPELPWEAVRDRAVGGGGCPPYGTQGAHVGPPGSWGRTQTAPAGPLDTVCGSLGSTCPGHVHQMWGHSIEQKFKAPGRKKGHCPRRDRAVPPASQRCLQFRPSFPLLFLPGELRAARGSLLSLARWKQVAGVGLGGGRRIPTAWLDRSSEMGPRSPDFWAEGLGKVGPRLAFGPCDVPAGHWLERFFRTQIRPHPTPTHTSWGRERTQVSTG